ncbi:MAG: hypothetical protein JWL99_5555, partial [Streptomyces oryziradicis]|nr:hypothetical protein [Actinacidiphila oryziradicis]
WAAIFLAEAFMAEGMDGKNVPVLDAIVWHSGEPM